MNPQSERHGVSLRTALWRGLRRLCPNCGEASSFRGYLKVVEACPVCATRLDKYPTDDGPAYLTILIVGHLVIGPSFLIPALWTSPPEIVAPALLTVFGAITLVALPFIKGCFLSLLWYLQLKTVQ